MRLHALIKENTVTELKNLIEQEYQNLAGSYQLIIDIEDLLIQPQIGWILSGNQLVPPPGQEINLKEMIKKKVKQYQETAPELLRDLYAENTLLGITTQQSDQMFDDYQDVLMRIREGAWPTALYRLSQKEPSGFVTQEMIDVWYALILSKMI